MKVLRYRSVILTCVLLAIGLSSSNVFGAPMGDDTIEGNLSPITSSASTVSTTTSAALSPSTPTPLQTAQGSLSQLQTQLTTQQTNLQKLQVTAENVENYMIQNELTPQQTQSYTKILAAAKTNIVTAQGSIDELNLQIGKQQAVIDSLQLATTADVNSSTAESIASASDVLSGYIAQMNQQIFNQRVTVAGTQEQILNLQTQIAAKTAPILTGDELANFANTQTLAISAAARGGNLDLSVYPRALQAKIQIYATAVTKQQGIQTAMEQYTGQGALTPAQEANFMSLQQQLVNVSGQMDTQEVALQQLITAQYAASPNSFIPGNDPAQLAAARTQLSDLQTMLPSQQSDLANMQAVNEQLTNLNSQVSSLKPISINNSEAVLSSVDKGLIETMNTFQRQYLQSVNKLVGDLKLTGVTDVNRFAVLQQFSQLGEQMTAFQTAVNNPGKISIIEIIQNFFVKLGKTLAGGSAFAASNQAQQEIQSTIARLSQSVSDIQNVLTTTISQPTVSEVDRVLAVTQLNMKLSVSLEQQAVEQQIKQQTVLTDNDLVNDDPLLIKQQQLTAIQTAVDAGRPITVADNEVLPQGLVQNANDYNSALQKQNPLLSGQEAPRFAANGSVNSVAPTRATTTNINPITGQSIASSAAVSPGVNDPINADTGLATNGELPNTISTNAATGLPDSSLSGLSNRLPSATIDPEHPDALPEIDPIRLP